jgi:hypothetical protein
MCDCTKGKELNQVGRQECSINAQYTIHVNCSKRTFKGNFAASQGVRIESTLVRWFSGQSGGRLDLVRGVQRFSNLSSLKGYHQA